MKTNIYNKDFALRKRDWGNSEMVHYVILGKRLVKGPCHEIIDV